MWSAKSCKDFIFLATSGTSKFILYSVSGVYIGNINNLHNSGGEAAVIGRVGGLVILYNSVTMM